MDLSFSLTPSLSLLVFIRKKVLNKIPKRFPAISEEKIN